MPVFEASYRRWDGKARATRGAAFAIASTMIPRLYKLKLVRYPVLVLPLLASLLSGTIFYFSYERIFQMLSQRLEWGDFELLNYVNQYFMFVVRPFGVILAAIAGGPLIAEDRRARALPLYFARPISHFDYVMGKMLSIGTFLAALFLIPPVVMYLVDISLAPGDDAWREELPAFLNSLIPAVCAVVVLSSVALAASSLCERSQFGTFLCIALLMVSAFVGATLGNVLDDPGWAMIAPTTALMRVTMDVVPVPDQVRVPPLRNLAGADVSAAWISLAVWTAASLFVLTVRIRKVEVVT